MSDYFGAGADDGSSNPLTGAFRNIQNYIRGRWPGPGGAQAAQVTQAPNPLTSPTPVDPRLTDIPIGPHTIPTPVLGPSGLRPPNANYLAPGALTGAALGAYNNMPFPGQPDINGVFAPKPGQGPPQSTSAPGAPIGVASPYNQPTWPSGGGSVNPAAPPPPGQIAPGTPAAVAAAPPDNRFTTFSYGVPGSGRGGNAPIYTALNLGGLFGGGGANPANVPAQNAAPMSGGALSKNSALSKAPWSYGPQQKGKVFPSEMGPFTPEQIAARSLKQRYS